MNLLFTANAELLFSNLSVREFEFQQSLIITSTREYNVKDEDDDDDDNDDDDNVVNKIMTMTKTATMMTTIARMTMMIMSARSKWGMSDVSGWVGGGQTELIGCH